MNNRKILGFMPLYYMGSYFKEALLSVEPFVDKMVVAYTATPSHGHNSLIGSPDKEQDIYRIAKEVLGEKLIWDRQPSYPSETHHRNKRYEYASGYDAILSIDCDEIMIGITEALEYAFSQPEEHFGINGYVNFFRSHSWACYDGFRPIRISVLGRNNGLQNHECKMTVLHFSCCQEESIMRMKYQVFGHASEIRPNYLDNIFYKWTPESDIKFLHPVSLDIWREATWYDKSQMPFYLKEHKNHSLDLIL